MVGQEGIQTGIARRILEPLTPKEYKSWEQLMKLALEPDAQFRDLRYCGYCGNRFYDTKLWFQMHIDKCENPKHTEREEDGLQEQG